MSVLEDLLPELTTDALAALVIDGGDGPAEEDLFFEFKRDFVSTSVAKSVAAFANAQGGFVMYGADAPDGPLIGFPGVEPRPDWPVRVKDGVVGILSPLPAWLPIVVAAPGSPNRVVVVVKVPASRRTPHVHVKSGKIYVRSPGGSSDPIKDRAELDALVRRGVASDAHVRARIAELLADVVPKPENVGAGEWRVVLASAPVPPDHAPQPQLLTRAGYMESVALLEGATMLPRQLEPAAILENGVVLIDDQRKDLSLYDDGAIRFVWELVSVQMVSLPKMLRAVMEALHVQMKLNPPVREARVHLAVYSGDGVHFGNEFQRICAEGEPAPRVWRWEGNVPLADAPILSLAENLLRRMWRAVGRREFDPD